MLFFASIGSGYGVHRDGILFNNTLTAKSIYKKQIRRYLGLGFFLSFIPGTDAFLSRNLLLNAIEKLEANIQENENGNNFFISSPYHIIWRLVIALIYYNVEKDLGTILVPANSFQGLNRLNPLLYIFQGLRALILLFHDYFPRQNFHAAVDSSILLKMIIFPIITVLWLIGIAFLLLGTSLYFLTEVLLNSLHTLVVEPLIFSYEAIYQLVTSWSFEFKLVPNEDYSKLMRLINALEVNEGLSQVTEGPEFTLIEASEKLQSEIEVQKESTFFKFYRGTDLFEQDNQVIREAHTRMESLYAFNLFFKQVLPVELREDITKTTLILK